MARDRLAAIRAQQAGSNSNPPQQSGGGRDPYENDYDDYYANSDRGDPVGGGYGEGYGQSSNGSQRPSASQQDSYGSSNPAPRDRRDRDDRRNEGRSRGEDRERERPGLPSGGPRPQPSSQQQRRPTNPPPENNSDQRNDRQNSEQNYYEPQQQSSRRRDEESSPSGNSRGVYPRPTSSNSRQPREQQDYSRSRNPAPSSSQHEYSRSDEYAPSRSNDSRQEPAYQQRQPPQQPPQPRYNNQQDDAGYGYGDDKGRSQTHLVNGSREEERYEMQRRDGDGRAKKAKPQGAMNSKGVRTIGRGDVQYEDMGEFFTEISDLQQALREANSLVQEIQSINLRLLSLASTDDPISISLTQSLTKQTASTRKYYASLKNRVLALAQGNADLKALIPAGQSQSNLTFQDVNVREVQVEALKEKFKDSVQRYAEVEREMREKKRNRMERQVRIVNPDLNQAEVKDVVRDAESGNGGGMFQQALLQSNGQRTAGARGALKEVQNRAVELAQIEATLTELAQLFNDMATLVVEQDIQVVAVEASAVAATEDLEKGLQQTQKAVVSAKSSRKMRWWCFGIFMTILVVVAIVVVFQVVIPIINKNKAAAKPPGT